MAKKRKRRKRKVATPTKRRTKKRTKKRQAVRRTAAADHGALIAQLTEYHAQLLQQQAVLQAQIQGVASALAALGKTPRAAAAAPARVARKGRGRRRTKGRGAGRKGSLRSYVVQVLGHGQVMSVKEVAGAVLKAGYQTSSTNFGNQVSNAMAKMTELRKVGRGRFQLK